jgi:signal transduction histidine kinase/CheY-like chemotaxis protein
MMRWIGNLSLAAKLRVMVVYAATITILIASAIYTTQQISRMRQDAAHHLLTLADVVGETAAAPMKASNRALARSILEAMNSDPGVRYAALLDTTGNLVAELAASKEDVDSHPLTAAGRPRDHSSTPADAAARESIRFEGLDRVYVRAPVSLRGEQVGSIQVEAQLTGLYSQLAGEMRYTFIGLMLAIAVAYALSVRLQRVISEPVQDLVRVARSVCESKNFSIRAEKQIDDEFGSLIDGFNEMLAELERRDLNLRVYQNELEKRVRERTAVLDAAVSEAQVAVARAEGASRAKSEFLARMSHEIRTPMNGVLGMAELLRQSPSLDERQRRYAATIHQSGSALLDIINDILDFSKIEAGKLELEIAPFSIRDIVEDAVDILAERAHSKGLELICDIPAQIDLTVRGDSQRLRQVIINLLSNAVKFTERGEVRVVVRHGGADLLNSRFHFEVRDTGIGIKPENCSSIFEAFAQEDSSTTRQYGGTGLGLAICKQLVELMGGKIGVTSTPGSGSTFFFDVPLSSDPSSVRDKRVTILDRSRMLIVDDNAAAREVLRHHLLNWGVNVSEASSGRQALDILDKAFGGQYDVLLIDGHMPEMSGAALTAAIRSRPDFVALPVVMMNSALASASPHDQPDDSSLAWISKPVRRAQLHACLTSILSHQSLAPKQAAKQAPKQAHPETRTATTPTNRRRSRVRRLLLVEDNAVNQEVAQAMLQELGVEPVSAWSGEEALEKLMQERYEVILMDCQMPKLDGYATATRFRRWEQENSRSRTPIVALTANALSGDAEKCFAAGMDYYLSKPFTTEQLYRVLESCGGGGEPPVEKSNTDDSDSPILDPQTLGRIRALHRPGGPDLFSKVVGLYCSSSVVLTETIRAATAARDAEAVRQAAHALRSSSANVGAIAFAELCREIEMAAIEADLEHARTMVDRLMSEHRQVLQALEAQTLAA